MAAAGDDIGALCVLLTDVAKAIETLSLKQKMEHEALVAAIQGLQEDVRFLSKVNAQTTRWGALPRWAAGAVLTVSLLAGWALGSWLLR